MTHVLSGISVDYQGTIRSVEAKAAFPATPEKEQHATMNALAVAQQHLGDLDRLKKLVKLSVVLATTEQFVEHAAVADGASDLFVSTLWHRKGSCANCVRCSKTADRHASHGGGHLRDQVTSREGAQLTVVHCNSDI